MTYGGGQILDLFLELYIYQHKVYAHFKLKILILYVETHLCLPRLKYEHNHNGAQHLSKLVSPHSNNTKQKLHKVIWFNVFKYTKFSLYNYSVKYVTPNNLSSIKSRFNRFKEIMWSPRI